MSNSFRVSFSFEREPELTSLQLQCSQLIRSFCQEAINPTSLATFLIGGAIFPFARAKTFTTLSSFCGVGRVSHYSSLAIATGLEGFSFCLTPKLLQRTSIDFDSLTPEAAHSVATIAVLKGIAPFFGGNLILTQLTQSVCLVGVNRAFRAWGLIDHPSQGFLFELVSAEVTSFQCSITGSLLKTALPQATWISAQCEIEYKVSKTPRFFPQLSPLRQSANEAPPELLRDYSKTENEKRENSLYATIKKESQGTKQTYFLPSRLSDRQKTLRNLLARMGESSDTLPSYISAEETIDFKTALRKLRDQWEVSTEELAEILGFKLPTMKSYLQGSITAPFLPRFYELAQAIEKNNSKLGKQKNTLMEERVALYLARNPEARALEIIDPQGRTLKIIFPKDKKSLWTYQKLRETTFGQILLDIIDEAKELGVQNLAAGYHSFPFSGRSLAVYLEVTPNYIQDLLKDAILEVPWPFVQKLFQFSENHLNGKYDISFLAASANPILYDLAEKVVSSNRKVLRTASYEEPFDFDYRYHNRKNYKGSKYKAS